MWQSESHVAVFVYHNQAGRGLLHPPASQSQSQDILEGVGDSQQQRLQSGSVLLANQAVEHRVEATICMSQTHSQREGISLGVVEGFTEGNQVKFDQNPPQGESLVWQPADEERENHDGDGAGDRAGDFGAAALASLLILCPLHDGAAHAAAHHALAEDELQKEEVAHRDDNQGHDKSQEHFLHLIESKQDLRVPVV